MSAILYSAGARLRFCQCWSCSRQSYFTADAAASLFCSRKSDIVKNRLLARPELATGAAAVVRRSISNVRQRSTFDREDRTKFRNLKKKKAVRKNEKAERRRERKFFSASSFEPLVSRLQQHQLSGIESSAYWRSGSGAYCGGVDHGRCYELLLLVVRLSVVAQERRTTFYFSRANEVAPSCSPLDPYWLTDWLNASTEDPRNKRRGQRGSGEAERRVQTKTSKKWQWQH